MILVIGGGRPLTQEGRHHAEQENHCAFCPAYEFPEAVGRKILHECDRAAARQHHEGDTKAANVEDRHVDQIAVLTRHKGPAFRPGIGVQMKVGR